MAMSTGDTPVWFITGCSTYDLGLKGCTVFRESDRPGVIGDHYLADSFREPERGSAHCCEIDRESD